MTAPSATEPSPRHGSRYRCREHPAQGVTWKGTGCHACLPPRGLNRAERRRLLREAEAEQHPTNEWEQSA